MNLNPEFSTPASQFHVTVTKNSWIKLNEYYTVSLAAYFLFFVYIVTSPLFSCLAAVILAASCSVSLLLTCLIRVR